MKPSLDDLFVRLEPPPGGEPLLRQRLSAWPLRPRRRLGWAVLTAAPAIAVLVVWLALPRAIDQRTTVAPYPLSHPAFGDLGLEPEVSAPVAVPTHLRDRVAVTPVAVEGDVIFYLVASSLPGFDPDRATEGR